MQASMKPKPTATAPATAPSTTTAAMAQGDGSSLPAAIAPTIGCGNSVTCANSKAEGAGDCGDVIGMRTKRFAAVCIDGQSHCTHHAPLPHHQHHLHQGLDEEDAIAPHSPDGGEPDSLCASTEARSPKRTASDADELGSPGGRADECHHADGSCRDTSGQAGTCAHNHANPDSSSGNDGDVAVGLRAKRPNHRSHRGSASSGGALHVAFDEPLVATIHSTWPAEEYERALQPSDQYICRACAYFTDIVHYRCRTCADYDLCPACYEAIYDEHKLEPKCQHPKSCFMYMCDGLD